MNSITTPRLRWSRSGVVEAKLPYTKTRREWLAGFMHTQRPEWVRDDASIGGGHWVIPSEFAEDLTRLCVWEYGSISIWFEGDLGWNDGPMSFIESVAQWVDAEPVETATGTIWKFTLTADELDRFDREGADL